MVRGFRILPQTDDVRIHAAARDRLAELVDDEQIEVVEWDAREVQFRDPQQTDVRLDECIVSGWYDLDDARLPVAVLDDGDATQDTSLGQLQPGHGPHRFPQPMAVCLVGAGLL